jgi:hypothetical protein
LSPGDRSYNEPYWYVSPYPYPETVNLPTLDGNGFWHTHHWVGGVLRASQLMITTASNPQSQKQQVEAFLNSAFQESMGLLMI